MLVTLLIRGDNRPFESFGTEDELSDAEARVGIRQVGRAKVFMGGVFCFAKRGVELILLFLLPFGGLVNVLLDFCDGGSGVLLLEGFHHEGLDLPRERLAVSFIARRQVLEDRLDVVDCVRDRHELLHQKPHDVGVGGMVQDEVDDHDILVFRSQSLDSADALLHGHRIPGKIEVHDVVAGLQIYAFRARIGRDHAMDQRWFGLEGVDCLTIGDRMATADEAVGDPLRREPAPECLLGLGAFREDEDSPVGRIEPLQIVCECAEVFELGREGIPVGERAHCLRSFGKMWPRGSHVSELKCQRLRAAEQGLGE